MKLPHCLGAALLVAAVAHGAPTAAEHDAARTAYVAEINAMPGILWQARVNSKFKVGFQLRGSLSSSHPHILSPNTNPSPHAPPPPPYSDPKGQPIGASKSLCGVHASNKQALHDAVANGTIEVWKPSSSRGRVAIPDAFDSETNWPKCAKVIGDIRDQSACGCCWAFGAAEAASDRLCIATNGTVAVPLSAQATCFCAQDQGCNGGQLQTAWSFISNEGVVTGGQVRASCKVYPAGVPNREQGPEQPRGTANALHRRCSALHIPIHSTLSSIDPSAHFTTRTHTHTQTHTHKHTQTHTHDLPSTPPLILPIRPKVNSSGPFNS